MKTTKQEELNDVNSFRMTYNCLKCGKDNKSTEPKDLCLLCNKKIRKVKK